MVKHTKREEGCGRPRATIVLTRVVMPAVSQREMRTKARGWACLAPEVNPFFQLLQSSGSPPLNMRIARTPLAQVAISSDALLDEGVQQGENSRGSQPSYFFMPSDQLDRPFLRGKRLCPKRAELFRELAGIPKALEPATMMRLKKTDNSSTWSFDAMVGTNGRYCFSFIG